MVSHAAMRTPAIKRWAGAVALCAGLALAGCSQKDEHSIVGKWQRGNDVMVTFTKDGDMIKQSGINTDAMEYSVKDGVLYLKPKDLPMSLPYTITFPSDNELVLTPQPVRGVASQNPEPEHLTRVKE
jgi:hypothetical protein